MTNPRGSTVNVRRSELLGRCVLKYIDFLIILLLLVQVKFSFEDQQWVHYWSRSNIKQMERNDLSF